MSESEITLKLLRRELDQLNSDVLHALMKRFAVVKQIGELKARYGLELEDPNRVHEMLSMLHGEWSEQKVDSCTWPLIERTLRTVFEESLEYQRSKMLE